eukprot:2709711-Pleurochrysis_carterae.AAC.2
MCVRPKAQVRAAHVCILKRSFMRARLELCVHARPAVRACGLRLFAAQPVRHDAADPLRRHAPYAPRVPIGAALRRGHHAGRPVRRLSLH